MSGPPAGIPEGGHTFVVLGTALNSDGTLKAKAVNRLRVAMAALAAYPNYKLPKYAKTDTKTITVKYSGSKTVKGATGTTKLKLTKK